MAYGDKIKQVLKYIRENPHLMQYEIAKGVGVEDSKKINGQIVALKIQGKIEQVNGGYIVSPDYIDELEFRSGLGLMKKDEEV